MDLPADQVASSAIKQSREFLEHIVNAIAEPVFVKDRAHRFLMTNEAFCRLAGVGPQDLLGKTDRDHFEAGLCDAFWACDDLAFESGQEVCVEEEYRSPEESVHFVRTRKRVFVNPVDGERVVVGIVSDVTDEVRAKRQLEGARDDLERQVEARTAELRRANQELTREIEERRRAEESLRETEAALQHMNEFLEGIVDTIYDPIFIKDESHRWIMLNNACCELWGYSRDELMGKSDYDFFPREQADIFWEKDRRVLESGVDDVNEELLTDSQGRTHVISTKKSLFVTSGGRRILVGIITDVTAQKMAEQELRTAKVQAEMANRAKSIFLANMSHEIRTPLNNILGLLDLLELTDVNSEQHEYLRMARTSARDLTRLINDVLDLSAVEAGRASLESVHFDLVELIAGLYKTFTVASNRKGLKLSCRCHEDVPRLVAGDPGRLKLIIGNLLGNAVKFTEQGDISMDVECVERAETSCRVRFVVRDTGIGIAEVDREAIFNAFTQADSSTTKRYPGTGLGLYVVKVLVDMMGGTLGVASEPGQGSDFWFEIPFPLVVAAAPTPASPALEGGGGGGHRILVAEDNTGTQFLLKALLAKLGYTAVVIVDDGNKAVDELKERPYDLVLMDVQMPDMDGLEATRIIRAMERERGGHTPIVACTAYAMEEDRARCFEAGMDACVTKPLDGRILLDTVRRWMSPVPPSGA